MKRRRRRYTPTEKVGILKRHLVDKEEVSAICEELKLHPNQFYDWQKQFFDHGAKAFENEGRSEEARLKEELSKLQAKLTKKDSAMSDLLLEHMALKKTLGED